MINMKIILDETNLFCYETLKDNVCLCINEKKVKTNKSKPNFLELVSIKDEL